MAGDRNAHARAIHAAGEHRQNHNWSEASKAYRQALDEFPRDVSATVGLGVTFLNRGELEYALKAFQRAALLAPQDPRPLFHLADVQERQGMLEQASACYTKIGDIYAQRGELENVVDAWTRASRLAPDNSTIYQQLAQVLEQMGRPAQAAVEYATLAAILERQGKQDQSLEIYQKAIGLDPGNRQLKAKIGSLEDQWVATAGAESTWGEADSSPSESGQEGNDNIFNLENLTNVEERMNHSPFDMARQRAMQELADMLFEIGTEEGPTPAMAITIGQAIDQQTRGQVDEAIQNFRKVLDSGLNSTALLFNLGALYFERRQYDNAIQAFRHSMRDSEYTLGSHFALGRTYHAAGKIDRALEHIVEVVKAVDLQSADQKQVSQLTTAYQQLSDKYIAKGDTDQANRFTRTLIKFFSSRDWERKSRNARRDMDLYSNNGSVVMTLAEYLETPEMEIILTTMRRTSAYMQRNMLMTAAEECYHAIALAPSCLPLHARLADILLRQDRNEQAVAAYLSVADVFQMRGDKESAQSIYQNVLHVAPMDVRAREKMVDLLIRQNEFDQVLEHYLILADTHYQLAQVEQALEICGRALEWVSRTTNQQKWESRILHRMGDIFSQRVDWARATAAYESIIAITPEDEKALSALVDLYFKQGQSNKGLNSFETLLAIYREAGDTEKVLTTSQESVQTYPDELGLRANLAAVYARQGSEQQAITEYEVLGKLQLKAGLRDEAARSIQAIIDLDPDNVDEYHHLLSQVKGTHR